MPINLSHYMQKLTLILPSMNRTAVFSFPRSILRLPFIAEVPLLETLKAIALISRYPRLNWFLPPCIPKLDYNFWSVPVTCPRLLSTHEWTFATNLTSTEFGI